MVEKTKKEYQKELKSLKSKHNALETKAEKTLKKLDIKLEQLQKVEADLISANILVGEGQELLDKANETNEEQETTLQLSSDRIAGLNSEKLDLNSIIEAQSQALATLKAQPSAPAAPTQYKATWWSESHTIGTLEKITSEITPSHAIKMIEVHQ